MPSKSKYDQLLQDHDVRRWRDNLAARSVIMAGVYLRTLGLYCSLAGTTPKKILAEPRQAIVQGGLLRRLQ